MNFSVDEAYMRMALSLAQEGLGRVWPNPSVGCVLVNDGVPVGYGRTADGGRPHAETQAVDAAGDRAKGATAYVTLEPCHHDGATPPCAQVLIDAGVVRVVVACLDPDPRTSGQGAERMKQAGLDVDVGLCDGLARDLNIGFFLRLEKKRPFICLKQAVSADGMIASAPGQRTQISGVEAQEYTHLLRSTFDAIGVGANTVLVDNPSLTTRVEGHDHSIVRVIFDSTLQTPTNCRLFDEVNKNPLWIVHKGTQHQGKVHVENGADLIESGACVQSVMHSLADRGITRLLVEGGAKVHHSFIKAGLFDEVQILRSKVELGRGGVSAATLDLDSMSLIEKRELGEDLLEIYRP